MKFKIYQIKDIETCPYSFWKYDEKKFSLDDYKVVWESNEYFPINNTNSGNIISVLERIFEIFNLNHPEGFKGHSLSVSDVVEIIDDGENSGFYYCDNFGWKKIEVANR